MLSDQQYINQLQDEYHAAIGLPQVIKQWDEISKKLDALKLELNTPKPLVKSASDIQMENFLNND